MPRLILKSPYLSPDSFKDRGGYAVYIATREGVETIPPEKRELPASLKQRKLIANIVKDFPSSLESFEYEDYIANPTTGNASEFISRAMEENYIEVRGREGYMQYIAQRPRVSKIGEHGLFGAKDGQMVLSRIADELRDHPGNIWTPILSLRREDASRLGYDNADAWQQLLRKHAKTVAQWFKIRPDDFVWYAAYHDESHHPHIHMMCYSRDPTKGFLTVDGIRGIKSDIVRDIFRIELEELYQKQTVHRKSTSMAAHTAMLDIVDQMRGGVLASDAITEKMVALAGRLQNYKGKMVYGYLRPPVKVLVDSIVDELAKDQRVAAAYQQWCEARQEIIHNYRDNGEPIQPLSQNNVFKPIRNMVVAEAAKLARGDFTTEQVVQETDDEGPPEDSAQEDNPALVEPSAVPETESPPNLVDEYAIPEPIGPNAKWSKEYKRALFFLYGNKDNPPSHEDAYELLAQEAEKQNALAIHDLGKMNQYGLGREIDAAAAEQWYTKALATFHTVEKNKPDLYVEYRIGKMYNAGLGTEADYKEAAKWFKISAARNYKYAQYSLGCLYRDGKGVEQDDSAAYRLFAAAAEQKFPYASYECGKMLRDGIGVAQNVQHSDEAFTEAFAGFKAMEEERADDKLQYRLGYMLLKGIGTEVDMDEAVVYFKKAAKQNNVYALYQLASIYLKHEDKYPAQFENAVAMLTEAAKADMETAQYALGKLLLEDARIQNIGTALYWLEKAASPTDKNPAGNSFAQYKLGKTFLSGALLPQDIPAAMYWLKMSASQGNEYAQYALGMAWLHPHEAGYNPQTAIPWLTMAGQQGNVFAAYQLGKLYLANDYVVRNPAEGVRWMSMAAEAGNEYAQYALGMAWLRPDQAGVDTQKAIHWLEKAAHQNNINAAYQLGKLYLTNNMVKSNPVVGLAWMNRAAEAGNQFAQYTLGKYYIFGERQYRNKESAIHWLICSAQQGNVYAQQLLARQDQWDQGPAVMSGTRLLIGIAQIFASQPPPPPPRGGARFGVDQKRRRELYQKKDGKGIQQAEEEQQMAQQ